MMTVTPESSIDMYTSTAILELDSAKFEEIRTVINNAYQSRAYLLEADVERVKTAEIMAEELKSDGVLLVLSQNDEVVATAAGLPFESDSWRAAMVATKPTRVRNGYGTQIMRHLESVACNAKMKKIALRHVIGEFGLIPFYEQLGYSITGKYSHGKGGSTRAVREYEFTTMELIL
jgi:GNAT superfamily N-acetyltransferase